MPPSSFIIYTQQLMNRERENQSNLWTNYIMCHMDNKDGGVFYNRLRCIAIDCQLLLHCRQPAYANKTTEHTLEVNYQAHTQSSLPLGVVRCQ